MRTAERQPSPGQLAAGGLPSRLVWFVIISCVAAGAEESSSGIALKLSSEIAPAGTTAQIKLSLTRPRSVASGRLTIDLDPVIFGDVTGVTAFSATGDVYGLATVSDRHVEIEIQSPSGTIGVLQGLPVAAITVRTLPDAAPGAKATVAIAPGGSSWKDLQGNAYPVELIPGSVTIGGEISVERVVPGGGVLPAGSVLRIDGAGFTPSTMVEMDATVLSSVDFVGPRQINVVLGAPTEIAGRRIRLRNPDGFEVDFFPSLITGPYGASPSAKWPILPMETYLGGRLTRFLPPAGETGWVALANPNPNPVDVTFDAIEVGDRVARHTAATIPAGTSTYYALNSLGVAGLSTLQVLASDPIRMLQILSRSGISPMLPAIYGTLQIAVSLDPLWWSWQIGSPLPGPRTFTVSSSRGVPSANFTVSAITQSGGGWLSATPSRGSTCQPWPCAGETSVISVAADPRSLSPGVYRGTITVTPVPSSVRPFAVPVEIPVSLTVSAVPFANTIIVATDFLAGPRSSSLSSSFPVSAQVFPGRFSVRVITYSGGNWLSATPSSGTSPAELRVSAVPGSLAAGRYGGAVIVSDSNSTHVIQVIFAIYGKGTMLRAYGSNATFESQPGFPVLQSAQTMVLAECFEGCPASGNQSVSWTASVRTESGGNWLSTTRSSDILTVAANPAGLAPGAYLGVVTVTSNAATPVQIPVALAIPRGTPAGPAPALPPPLTAIPPNPFFLMAESGSGVARRDQICVDSPAGRRSYDARVSTSAGGDWLTTALPTPAVTPSCVTIFVDSSHLTPGVYNGDVILTAATGSLSVPVTVRVVPPGAMPGAPVLGSVSNAASAFTGAVAAGEIVTIRGVGLGPPSAAGVMIDAEGRVATKLGSTRVLFDGIPAPLLYASTSQLSVIVPDWVSCQTATTVWVENNDIKSAVLALPVKPFAPGLFTIDSSGYGQAAVVNQDGFLNDPSRPADRGSVIQIYGTGVLPPGVDTARIANQPTPTSGIPVNVSIGGRDATVIYAGAAPGAVAGLFQINAIVPHDVEPGAQVPCIVTVGPAQSQDGVTIAVR